MKRNSMIAKILVVITLSLGTISVIQAQNARGITSVEETKDPVGERRAILVAISNYKKVKPTTSSTDDVKLMKKFLSANKFYEKDIDIFLDSNATAPAMYMQLKKILTAAKPNDEVILYFSVDFEVDKDLATKYLMMYGANFDSPEGSDVVDVDRLKSYMGDIAKKGAKVTLIVEAPHAGTIAQDWKDSPNVFGLFACMGKELNYEKSEDGNQYGMFTYHLIKGLQGEADANADNAVTLEELRFFLRRQLMDVHQNPVLVGDAAQVLLKVEQTKKAEKTPETLKTEPAKR